MSKKKEKNEKNENKKEDILTFRIITLGDSGVGKTSIINRYVKDIFNDNNASTIGINVSIKEIYFNQQKINLKLIDTCGQEKYHALTKSYLKNADACFFIFALNDKESFDNIKKWMELFNENNSIKDIPKMLLGNKNDLQKQIKDNLIQEYAETNEINYFETSAKDKKNINESMEELGQMLYKQYEKNNSSGKQHNNKIIISYKQPNNKKSCMARIKEFLFE